MKFAIKAIFVLWACLIATQTPAQSFMLTGKVTVNGEPVSGAIVTNSSASAKGEKVTTVTQANGTYSISAEKGDLIRVEFVGCKIYLKTLGNEKELDVQLENSNQMGEVIVTGAPSVSMRNPWLGAKIGYNFAGNTDDNFFVGSATIALNLLDNSSRNHMLGVVGNIGNFKFNRDTSETKNIQKLAQSINGLSVGLGYTYETSISGQNTYRNTGKKPVSYFRKFIQSGMRLNTFTKVGPDSATVNFPQFVTTGGLEFEQTGFANGGSITASMGVSLSLFDRGIYNKIFNEDKNHMVAVDFTVILPIAKNMGFFVNGTFARHTEGVYILGMIFKP